MHTTSFQGTSFTYNGDLSGPLVIVSKSHSVETTYAAIKEFVSYQEKQIALNALENGPVTSLFFTFGKHQNWYYRTSFGRGGRIESEEYRKLKHEGKLYETILKRIEENRI